METRLLRTFVAVAETASFRAAARRLGVSQPAVSQSIARLERTLGTSLFTRGRTASTTPDGAALLDPARRVLAELDALPGILDSHRGRVRGRLELGTTDVASIYVLPRVYRACRARHPEIEPSVRVEGSESLLAQLAAGAIELAVISLAVGDLRATLPGEGLRAETLFREDLEFVVAKRHPLAKRRRPTRADVAAHPFITFKRESITRQAIDRFFAEEGAAPRVAMEMSSPEAIKKLVEVGLGVSCLPARSVRAEVRAGVLVALAVRGGRIPRELGIVWNSRRPLSAAASAFLNLAREHRDR